MSFGNLVKILLCRSVKSLQLVLNEWEEYLGASVTASALTQARGKLSHTALIELFEECVVSPMYDDGEFERFRGLRLLAIDGSTLRLPDTPATREEFG